MNISKQGKNKSNNYGVLLGAAFIMATSAIGPGFLTQTAVFTEKHAASFAFAIMISVLFLIGAQVNIWRIIGVSGMRGQDIANKVLPGLGYFIAALVGLGGLAFNIGNVGGAALGLNVMFGLDNTAGAIICGIIGIVIFLAKDAGPIIDRLTKILGGIMILIVGYMAITTNPPVGDALLKTVVPDNVNLLILPIITLIGGTVGGYIPFSGGHRLIDAGIVGKENVKEITKSSVMGITIASVMRVLLFLAVLGVVSKGVTLDASNPAASAFQHGAGVVGYKFFGMMIWAAGITSVVGAAYTSVSFLKTFHPFIKKNEKYFTIAFIAASTVIMVLLGRPVVLMVLAGALNGLILPVTLGTVLLASRRKDIIGDYKHPIWLLVFGIMVVIASSYAGITALKTISTLFK